MRAPVTWLADVFGLAWATASILTLDHRGAFDANEADQTVFRRASALPDGLPEAVRTVVLRGLSEEPSARPADVAEFCRALLDAVGLRHPEPFLPERD